MRGRTSRRADAKPVLLSGGNPQIAKADGDAPVQAYIAAMPGWKSDLGRRLDELIVRTVPGVRKCVRWNSPFYGVEGKGWFRQGRELALGGHLRGRSRRGADGDLGPAGGRHSGLGPYLTAIKAEGGCAARRGRPMRVR